MKKIAVFFKFPGAMDYPLSKPTYWASYSELSEAISNAGGQLYIVRGQDTYQGRGSFSNSWIIKNDSLVEAGPIVADVIYNKDKGQFKNDPTPIFNCEKIKQICDDKWIMYQTFPDYCPKTFFVTTEEELHSILPNVSTSKVVFKPYTGGEGKGIHIEEKNYFLTLPELLDFPAVVSEFLDTSCGIPGIVDGLHDLRVAIFDGEILYSYVRTPPKDSFLANVSKGGRFEMVDTKRLPEEVAEMTHTIDSTLSDCGHRFYGIDFGYTMDGPKIIEMNSELGLLPNEDHPVFITLKNKLARVFMDL